MKIFAAGVNDIVGPVKSPLPAAYGSLSGGGLIKFFTNIIRLFFVVAGILALLNFLYAGFLYMMAAGDAKKLTDAWARIYMSLIGLVVLVSSFALAAIFGYIIFGDAGFILNPTIYGP